jgi:hypothetical protein
MTNDKLALMAATVDVCSASAGGENLSQKRLAQLTQKAQSPSAVVVCYLLFAICDSVR